MKIGLIDVDGGGKRKHWGATIYPNLALSKISAYHKQQGDTVEWYDPMFGGNYDVVYMSKIFNFTTDYQYPIHADQVIKGGTGFDLHTTLPQHIDDMQPDLTIYPSIAKDTSFGFLTRGCPNKCPWCVVPIKEGAVRPYWDISRVADGRSNVVLMDNNILAAGDYCKEQLYKIAAMEIKVDFNQALDARLLDDEKARLLSRVRWIDNTIRFGCDTRQQIGECERAIDMLTAYGFKGKFFLYTMIGGPRATFEECHDRVRHWWVRCLEQRRTKQGNVVFPYVQPYRNPQHTNTVPQWQKDMASWCNRKAFFLSTDFKDYQPRKGFKCSQYFKTI